MNMDLDCNIEVSLVMYKDGKPSYVEWYSVVDSRYHIASVDRFLSMFGYTLDELLNEGVQERV